MACLLAAAGGGIVGALRRLCRGLADYLCGRACDTDWDRLLKCAALDFAARFLAMLALCKGTDIPKNEAEQIEFQIINGIFNFDVNLVAGVACRHLA